MAIIKNYFESMKKNFYNQMNIKIAATKKLQKSK